MPLENTSTLMIDYSKTEVAANKAVTLDPNIRLFSWHFFRPLSSQANSKISNSSDRKSALYEFRAKIRTRSLSGLYGSWENYEHMYVTHLEVIRFIESQWMNDVENWWSGYCILSLILLKLLKAKS